MLPPEKGEQLQAMMREYWRAVYEDATFEEGDTVSPERNLPGHVGPRGRNTMHGVLSQEAVRLVGLEVKSAYDRVVQQGQQRIDDVVKQLDLSAEQEAKVRAIAIEFGQQAKLNPTPTQRAELFQKLMKELTPEQQRKLVTMVSAK